MSEILLTEDQTRIVRASTGAVTVRDATGRIFAVLQKSDSTAGSTAGASSEEGSFSTEEKEMILHRMSQNDIEWSTTPQILERIRSRAGK